MRGEPSDRHLLGEDKAIDALQARIDAANDAEDKRKGGKPAEPDAGYRMGNRVLADLIAGVGGGALIGWLLDSWLGTSPWFLLGLLFLGMIAAFRNIMKLSGGQGD